MKSLNMRVPIKHVIEICDHPVLKIHLLLTGHEAEELLQTNFNPGNVAFDLEEVPFGAFELVFLD